MKRKLSLHQYGRTWLIHCGSPILAGEDLSYKTSDALTSLVRGRAVRLKTPTKRDVIAVVSTHRPHRYDYVLNQTYSPFSSYNFYSSPFGDVSICHDGLKTLFGELPTKLYVKIEDA